MSEQNDKKLVVDIVMINEWANAQNQDNAGGVSWLPHDFRVSYLGVETSKLEDCRCSKTLKWKPKNYGVLDWL